MCAEAPTFDLLSRPIPDYVTDEYLAFILVLIGLGGKKKANIYVLDQGGMTGITHNGDFGGNVVCVRPELFEFDS